MGLRCWSKQAQPCVWGLMLAWWGTLGHWKERRHPHVCVCVCAVVRGLADVAVPQGAVAGNVWACLATCCPPILPLRSEDILVPLSPP